MSFDAGSIFVSMIVSGVGFVLFSYGKSRGRPPYLGTGIVLMIYPYFVPSVGAMLAIGAGLVALLTLAVKLGM